MLSQAVLTELALELAKPGVRDTEIDVENNRVRVFVAVLDQAVRAEFATRTAAVDVVAVATIED